MYCRRPTNAVPKTPREAAFPRNRQNPGLAALPLGADGGPPLSVLDILAPEM
jgi:hypothetical protein